MVRALLTGRKTQTRRIVKPQPVGLNSMQARAENEFVEIVFQSLEKQCPYGQPGDHLWVRETIGRRPASFLGLEATNGVEEAFYKADGADVVENKGFNLCPWWNGPVCVSIHMPRYASRITLEITDVRVERLQDISEEDAIEEGVETIHVEQAPSPANDFEGGHFLGMKDYENPGEFAGFGGDAGYCNSAKQSYRTLWESINGPGSWGSNPFVWVVTFNRIKP